jgi:hypothetical protein
MNGKPCNKPTILRFIAPHFQTNMKTGYIMKDKSFFCKDKEPEWLECRNMIIQSVKEMTESSWLSNNMVADKASSVKEHNFYLYLQN